MRQALAGGAWVSTAAGVLLAFALFASRGSSDSRLFWIGLAALGAATLVLTLRPPRLSPPTVAFLGLLVAFALWQAVTIAWSIQPASSWDYANRTLVYLGFAAVSTNASGDVSFDVTLTAVVTPGQAITATATDAAGNTSEFSRVHDRPASSDSRH